jgi:hypothetical protein
MPSEHDHISIASLAVDQKHILRLDILSPSGLEIFTQALRDLAANKTEQISLNDLHGVLFPKRERLYLALSSEDPTITIIWRITGHHFKRGLGPDFFWRRSTTGWQSCLEIAERLSPGDHHSFALETDSAGLEVSYLDQRAAPPTD